MHARLLLCKVRLHVRLATIPSFTARPARKAGQGARLAVRSEQRHHPAWDAFCKRLTCPHVQRGAQQGARMGPQAG